MKGVVKTTVGYSGGDSATAIYRAVTSMDTGHAEAIEIVYDPSLISFGTLLRIFFSVMHDPTQLNRQGADTGTQYRSHIFYTNEEQREVSEAYVKQLDDTNGFSPAGPIVTADHAAHRVSFPVRITTRTTRSRTRTILISRSATSPRSPHSSSNSPICLRITHSRAFPSEKLRYGSAYGSLTGSSSFCFMR